MSYESAMQRVSELASLVDTRSVGATPAATSQADAKAFAELMSQAQEREGAALTGDEAPAPGMPSNRMADRSGGYASMTGAPLPGLPAGAGSYMPQPGGYPTALPPVGVGTYPPTGFPAPGYPMPYPGVGGVGGAWPTTWPGAGGAVGGKIVQMAQQELGVRESPMGSNDAPRIKDYRTSTAGAENIPGPWCAYFVSWLCKEAGAPIGDGGQGTGYVPTLEAWGRSSGKWVEGAQRPQPGDIVIFNWGGSGISDHTGIVERVGPDGTVHTIEGNSSNSVARRTYPSGSVHVKGFVRPA